MKKRALVLIIICLLVTSIITLVIACNKDGELPDDINIPGDSIDDLVDDDTLDTNDDDNNSDNEPGKLNEFSGLSFENKTFTYDGVQQELLVTGTLPEGASISYTNNKGINAGTYNATAKIICENYQDLTLTATLTIDKADITGVSFVDKTYTFDGNNKNITITGTLPAGTTVFYSNHAGINAGIYNATAKITGANYNDLNLSATLTIDKADITGVTFDDYTCDYDGSEHTILAVGIPAEATAKYNNNIGINADTYSATVTVSRPCGNYNDKILKATLTINKIALPEMEFKSETFEYDEAEHSITVTGSIPTSVSIAYSGGENKNKATNVGKYEITAVISGQNYITKTLTATLTIKSTEELLSVIRFGGNIYFQNALDKNRLYTYDGTTVTKINNEKPEYFVDGGSKLYYFSPSVLSSSIASFDGTNSNNLFDVKGEYLTTDGTNLYYSVSSIFKPENNGIYKISISDLENQNIDPTPIKITSSKTEYLVYANGYIYFSNKSDGEKLYRISVLAVDGQATLVYNYKVSELIVDSNKIYFTRHFTLSNMSPGAAIYGIDISGSFALPIADEDARITKITYSKGKYLQKIGDYIYFVNTDLVTATIFGDGVYKASADGSNWAGDTFDLLAGTTKVLDGETDKIYSLATDGTNLFYYRANNKHLYMYDSSSETDLMDGFVAPEDPVSLSTPGHAQMLEYKGDLYYINLRDGGRLYKYSISQDEEYRITGLKIADFAIYGDYLYYASVRFLVNYDLYKLHLITGDLERISVDKCLHMSFTDTKIYYTNFSGSNTLNSMNHDGTNDTIIFDTKKPNDYKTTIYENKLYFVADKNFYVWDLDTQSATLLNNTAQPNEYIIVNDIIYLMNNKISTNYFASLSPDGLVLKDIENLGMWDDARGMFTFGDYVYYYRNVASDSSKKGLYRVDMTSPSPSASLIALDDGLYQISSPVVIGDKVYFIDLWLAKDAIPYSSGALCVLDLNTFNVTVLKNK